MDWTTLKKKCYRYWEMWLPKHTKKLKEAHQLDEAVQIAVAETQSEFIALLARGHREHEAKALVLQKYIFLKPEPADF
jgi:hypothetical protein